MKGDLRPGRCWYCGEEHLLEGDPPEHIIPAAIGGRLTTDRVAEKCNNEMGKAIDEPFLDDVFVALSRVLYDIRDPRRRQDRPPPNPEHDAELEDGTKVRVDMRSKPWRPTIIPQVIEKDEGVFEVKASSEKQAEEIIRKKLERMKRDGIDVSSVSIEQSESEGHDSVIVRGEVGGSIRFRALAKMTLATLSKVLHDDWLDTPDAKYLLSCLRTEKPMTPDGSQLALAFPLEKPANLQAMLKPPEHLIFFLASGRDAANIIIVLFGTEVMGHQIALEGARLPRQAWLMDPENFKLQEISFDQLSLRAVKALTEEHGEEWKGGPVI